jgi:parvulin-like peptidyl-prolyl isomerase
MENQTGEISQTQASVTSRAKGKYVFKINKRTTLLTIIILAVLGVLFYFKGLFIAAIVDGKPISRFEVIKELENTSGRQALDALVVKQLISAEANKAGVAVSQEDVDAEIQKIKDKISKQGGTLEMILAQQGINQDQFREQISLQKKLEKILGDKIQVTDEEVNQYFTQNKITPPAGVSEDEIKNQIREQLKNQKFSTEADKWVTDHKSQASIQYYVWYGKSEPEPAQEPPVSTEAPAETQNPQEAK